MQRRILITGAGGQLAHDLQAAFVTDSEVLALRREQCDITSPSACEDIVTSFHPHIILNPAAYNQVDGAEETPMPAFAVNALAPHALARAATAVGARLVHYSTDYVFSGRHPTDVDRRASQPYQESDRPDPLNAYAVSKLAGESMVLNEGDHYVLRVCGLFGIGGVLSRQGNFVERMVGLARAGRSLRVVCDQVVAPTYCVDVARVTRQLVDNALPGRLYHCTADGGCSWFEYTQAILRVFGLRADVQPVTATAYGARARRPTYSLLDNARLVDAGVPRPGHWHDGLVRYQQQRGEAL